MKQGFSPGHWHAVLVFNIQYSVEWVVARHSGPFITAVEETELYSVEPSARLLPEALLLRRALNPYLI